MHVTGRCAGSLLPAAPSMPLLSSVTDACMWRRWRVSSMPYSRKPTAAHKGGLLMPTPLANSRFGEGISRRALLQTSLAAGLTLSALPLSRPAPLWGAEAGPPKRGGILRVRGYDPTHFDPHLTISFKTHATLSFVYSRLVRHKVGTGVQP